MSENSQTEDPRLNFKRSAVVLFALEQSLGSYVRENVADAEDLPESQIKRFRSEGGQALIEDIVQQTYIGEILDLAIAAAELASDKPHLRRLKDLADFLELYDIRNAVCHPNRKFPDVYWYRLAAIVNEPAVKILNLNEVSAAFEAALFGKIDAHFPPDDWFNELAFELPNNLPSEIEHEITGLIGRDREKKELLVRLRNKRTRLISLVGVGGTGKTAIALDVLREIVLDPKSFDWTDEVIYVTAKTEKLTKDGPIPILNPIDSIESVKVAIFEALRDHCESESTPSDFEELKEILASRRILICIDNLETILRDHATSFEEFESKLPDNWRLLVTSRLPVDSAKNIPVDPMGKAAATVLSRDYMYKRGGDSLKFSVFERLAERSSYNPLAIRITIDSVIHGMQIDDALNVAKDHILEFSYTSLLESLPEVANRVLECLFAAGERQSRSDICFLLESSLDDVALGLLSLLRTSLITRHADDGDETYSLSASIRDLLLRIPLNDDARTQVFHRLSERQKVLNAIQQQEQLDPLDRLFIDPTINKPYLHETYRAFKQIRKNSTKTALANQLELLRRHLSVDQQSALLFRATALLLMELNDRGGARRMLEQARLNNAIDDSGRLVLAEMYKNENRFDECLDVAASFDVNSCFSNEEFSNTSLYRLAKVTWLVKIWNGRAMEVVPHVSDWDRDDRLRAIKGSVYIAGLKRLMEDTQDVAKLSSYASELFACLDQIFRVHGYVGFVVAEAVKAMEELSIKLRHVSITSDVANGIALFFNEHLSAICSAHNTVNIDEAFIQELIQRINDLSEVSLKTSRWDATATDSALEEFGLIPVTIYKRPLDMFGQYTKYLFARDDDGIEYHVSQRSYVNPSSFDDLERGDRIMVLPRKDFVDDGRARPVQDAVGID